MFAARDRGCPPRGARSRGLSVQTHRSRLKFVLFSARALHKQYAAGVPGCSATARVLTGVELELAQGDVVGVVGRRASGKTTLLRCVAGLARPDAGALHWAEGARRPRLVSISPAAYPFETVGDVVNRACAEPAVDPGRLGPLIEELGMLTVLDAAQFALTTCGRARLALAIGLATEAPLVLLDGAADAISAAWREAVRALLMAKADAGGAVLVAGRDEAGVSALVRSMLSLRNGRLEVAGQERDRRPPARVAERKAREV
jgi:ABC-type transport system involved in cytochrome c biogenesis ATPase subunit